MKIIIHSLDELRALAELITYGETPREVRIDNKIELKDSEFLRKYVTPDILAPLRADAATSEPEGLPTDIARPVSVALRQEPDVNDDLPGIDADGVAHSTDWHSEPAKINADGRWRARRKRDEDAYKAWLLERAVEAAEAAIPADNADPVATETHALPQDEDSREAGADYAGEGGKPQVDTEAVMVEDAFKPAYTEPAVDLEALIAASLEAAQDASDSHVDLLNACRVFTSKHGHPAFTALKAAVAPDDAGGGRAVQHFTPGERRLMQACIANYPSN